MPSNCNRCHAEIVWRSIKKDNGGVIWTPLNIETLTDHRETCEWKKRAQADADRKVIEKSNARRFGKNRAQGAIKKALDALVRETRATPVGSQFTI